MQKSFYDLDYIVELGEKRVEQYTSAYQLILGRLANILLIYSILGIYLIPITQDLTTGCPLGFWCAAMIMFGLISVSLYFALNLMWPVSISYLEVSGNYHENLRLQYEERILKSEMTEEETKNARDIISQLLKASYIDELNEAQINNRDAFVRKNGYYFRALVWALAAVLPYIICIGFHISKKEDKVQKVEIINGKNCVNCLTK